MYWFIEIIYITRIKESYKSSKLLIKIKLSFRDVYILNSFGIHKNRDGFLSSSGTIKQI
jgi:hypothetical protein